MGAAESRVTAQQLARCTSGPTNDRGLRREERRVVRTAAEGIGDGAHRESTEPFQHRVRVSAGVATRSPEIAAVWKRRCALHGHLAHMPNVQAGMAARMPCRCCRRKKLVASAKHEKQQGLHSVLGLWCTECRQVTEWVPLSERLFSRVVQSEIRKVDVYYMYFSRSS